jgi:hypothetical protein
MVSMAPSAFAAVPLSAREKAAIAMESKLGDRLGDSPHLPQDCEDQMQLGIRIVQNAYNNKASHMEQEIRTLRLTCEEQRNSLQTIQKQKSGLEVELVESHQRAQRLAEENTELFKTVQSLRKQIGRLESLKAIITTSLQDDNEKEAEIGDTRVLTSDGYLQSATPLTANYVGHGVRALTGGAVNAPRSGLDVAAPPQPQQLLGGYGGLSPGQSSPSAPVASPGVAQIDGKAFFRQAKNKLSFESFNQFLACIKRLNSQMQTREETLAESKRIFGPQYNDLYVEFECLLNRSS